MRLKDSFSGGLRYTGGLLPMQRGKFGWLQAPATPVALSGLSDLSSLQVLN